MPGRFQLRIRRDKAKIRMRFTDDTDPSRTTRIRHGRHGSVTDDTCRTRVAIAPRLRVFSVSRRRIRRGSPVPRVCVRACVEADGFGAARPCSRGAREMCEKKGGLQVCEQKRGGCRCASREGEAAAQRGGRRLPRGHCDSDVGAGSCVCEGGGKHQSGRRGLGVGGHMEASEKKALTLVCTGDSDVPDLIQ